MTIFLAILSVVLFLIVGLLGIYIKHLKGVYDKAYLKRADNLDKRANKMRKKADNYRSHVKSKK